MQMREMRPRGGWKGKKARGSIYGHQEYILSSHIKNCPCAPALSSNDIVLEANCITRGQAVSQSKAVKELI